MPAAPSSQVEFAHRLRGIAALIVMLHHYLTFMYAPPQGVMNAINSPAAIGSNDAVTLTLLRWQYILQPYALDFRGWGLFGVALFFLVSGFVIPFAVMRISMHGFLLGRLARLWPVYAVCFLTVIAMLALNSALAHMPIPFGLYEIADHLLFVQNWRHDWSLDLVSWSLYVEIVFYLFCACMVIPLRQGNLGFLFTATYVVSLVACGLAFFTSDVQGMAWSQLLRDLHYLPYLMVGVLFNFHYRKVIRWRYLILGVPALMTLYVGTSFLVDQNFIKAYQPTQFYNLVYIYALVLFALVYVIYDRWTFLPFWLGYALDRLADISYPLYLIHAIHGYIIINLLARWGVPSELAALAAILWVLAFAALVHRWVEVPTHAWARHLAGRYPFLPNTKPWYA